MKNTTEAAPKLDVSSGPLSVYEGGGLTEIKVGDLLDNRTAICQLVNQYNTSLVSLVEKENEIKRIEAERDYLKTSPFFSIANAIVTIVATTLVSVLAGMLTATSQENLQSLYTLLIILSSGLLLVSQVSNILFPFVRNWFKGISGRSK